MKMPRITMILEEGIELTTITSFSGKYRFLSNMFVCLLIDDEGNEFKSSEHYYHFHKVIDMSEKQEIQSAKNPMTAKILGRKCKLRYNWDEIKEKVMEDGLRLKFKNKYLKRKLLKTYPLELIEGNYWGDVYWGKVNGKGQNKLGKLLMKIRDEMIIERCEIL